MTADGDSQDEAMDEAMDETRRSDAPVDERGGRYKFGSIYFEESRIRCKYMLCDGDAPGACTPAEVLAEFTDAFGLELPSMCFRGLGANGWWESGFSTLDFQAQLDAVAGQVRSRSQEESDQRLMPLPDERARTALAAWGRLTKLDKNIVDNRVVTAANSEEVEEVAKALFTYNSAGVEVMREMDHYNDAMCRKKPLADLEAYKGLAKKVLATTLDKEMSLTLEGLREFEEFSKEFETVGAGDDKEKMPETAHQLVARCVERHTGQKETKNEIFRLMEPKLVQSTGRFLGDPALTAEALAAHAYAGDKEKSSAEAPAPAAEEVLSVPASEAEAPSIDELAKSVLKILEGKKREMYSGRLERSIKDLKTAWKDVCEAVRNANITKGQFTQVAKELLKKRQEERDKRLYDVQMENYASRGSSFMGAVVQAAYESKGWLISEWNCRESMNMSPAMFEKGIQRFSQLNDVSGLTYLGLHSTNQSLISKRELQKVVKSWRVEADGDESLKSSMKKKMAAALDAADERSPFQIWRYGSEVPIDLEKHARQNFQDARTVYTYKKTSTAVDGMVNELRMKWPRRDCAMRLRRAHGTHLPGDNKEAYDDLDHLCEILRAELSPYCTHMIFFRHEADKVAFSRYLWRLLPHATTVMCGKNKHGFDKAIERAQGGGQIILLRSSGFWVDQMCQAIVDARNRRTAGYKKRSTLTVPSDVHDSSWLVFDALREDANHIADRITKCLSMASREESAIIGFNRAEQARLLYAWQLVLTYRRNFERLSGWDLALSSITIICAMITTCTGLVAYADPAYFRGRGDVVAGLLSIATGFLLGAQRYFEFGTKAAACELAESEVKSLIYRYRTRTGDFSYGDGGESQLKASQAAFRAARAERQAKGLAFTRAFEKTEASMKETGTFDERAMTTLRQFESTGSEADAAADAAPAPVARGSNVRAERFQDQLAAAEARLRQSDVRTEPLQAGMTFDVYQRAGYMYDPAHSNTYDQVRELCCGWERTRRCCMWITGTSVSAAGRRVAPADGDADTDIVTIDKDFSVRQGVMNSQDSEDRDDGIGLVTGDDYERFRLLMNLRRLTKSSRRYGQIQQTLELARLLCMGAATGASLFGHPEYVVVALAVVGGLSAFATLLGGQQRVAMLISTISELHRIRIWWYSLSTVERRLLQHRERLVQDTESVLLTLAGAWAAASIKRARAAQDPDKKENDDFAATRQRRPEGA